MLKYLVFSLATVSVLAGCSGKPTHTVAQDQYCYTDSTTKISNGDTVDSTTLVQCSDNPLTRAKLVGVDPKNCRPWERRDYVNGYEKRYGGYICRDEKGNWRPLNQF